MSGTRIIKVPIKHMLEIPLAYEKAMIEWKGGDDDYSEDIWDAKIELKQINFERNFRRSNYECVFEITLGDYLYAKEAAK